MTRTKGLEHRFKYHPPTNPDARSSHEQVREAAFTFAKEMDELLPADATGREKALVFTKIEEAMFWANAAIARHYGSEGGTVAEAGD